MATSLINNVLKKSTYFGTLTASEDYATLSFESSYVNDKNKCHQYYAKFGDCVYFMSDKETLSDESLKKIGKAEAITGWYNRFKQYERGVDGDQTNRFMLKEMERLGITKLYVYGLSTPRQFISVECTLTGDIVHVESKTAKLMETHYTELYLNEKDTNELPLCKQLK